MLSVSVSYLSQAVITHKSTFVHMAIDTAYSSFGRVLPKGDVSAIGQNGFTLSILGNHNLIIIELACEMMVIEVGSGID